MFFALFSGNLKGKFAKKGCSVFVSSVESYSTAAHYLLVSQDLKSTCLIVLCVYVACPLSRFHYGEEAVTQAPKLFCFSSLGIHFIRLEHKIYSRGWAKVFSI